MHILDYHQQTKHHLNRYAKGPDFIDWDAQPVSFRYYENTLNIPLPFTTDNFNILFSDLYQQDTSENSINLDNISAFLQLALGISAWKQYGNARWALRCNPSSGNLHPTEAYIITNTINTLSAGVYHYISENHSLEQRGNLNNNPLDNDNSFLLGLTSIPWREAWKYGERAFRYCQHDIGHAIASIRYAAGVLGWQITILDTFSDQNLAILLGLAQSDDFYKNEIEIPEVLLMISKEKSQEIVENTLIEKFKTIQWHGKANLLDPKHYTHWDIIDKAIDLTKKPSTEPLQPIYYNTPVLSEINTPNAVKIIQQRRSAQHFDNQTPLELYKFYRILEATLPRNSFPWDVFSHQHHIDLILFIHRVNELSPGLYILLRNPERKPLLQQALQQPAFTWNKIPSAPEHLPFYHLVSARANNTAKTLSCHQDIASHSAFSLGMLADFKQGLIENWTYKKLFWEAGIIGQILYLEAEVAGMRGTGIGCFFDDAVHQLLGLQNEDFQSIYHFTIGYPLEDKRIQTIAAYDHIKRNKA